MKKKKTLEERKVEAMELQAKVMQEDLIFRKEKAQEMKDLISLGVKMAIGEIGMEEGLAGLGVELPTQTKRKLKNDLLLAGKEIPILNGNGKQLRERRKRSL